MLGILPNFFAIAFFALSPVNAHAVPTSTARPQVVARNHGAHMPAPKLKANELAPLCRICATGRACGDNCQTKKTA